MILISSFDVKIDDGAKNYKPDHNEQCNFFGFFLRMRTLKGYFGRHGRRIW